MKALILTEYHRFEYREVPQPEPGPGDVLIEVKACGICGSDVHGMDGSTGRRIPPIIMGHEAAGTIVEMGSEVTQWARGDRVTFDSTIYCGHCDFCREGRTNLCDNRRVLGVSCGDYRQDGAFGEYVAVPQHILSGLPDDLSFERAALVEAVSIAIHAVGRTKVKPTDTGVVVGTGMIGLLVVQALRLAGCRRILAVDVNSSRLETACQLGADEKINAGQVDAAGEVRRMTGGRGADLAVEVVGMSETVQIGIAALRKGGQLTLVGNLSPRVELPLQAAVTNELNLTGSCASSGEYPDCLELMAKGAIRVDPLISAVAPLADGARWFESLYRKEGDLLKVILKP
jgi:L-iditol 2-dehydrogenase